MNIIINPFIVSGHIPAEYFCDRQEEAARLQPFLMNQQKAVLYAILEDEPVKAITSGAFTKKHRLKSPSATQSAVKALLKSDIVTKRDNMYSLSDPLMDLWLKRSLLNSK